MKKLFALLIALMVCVSVTACGGDDVAPPPAPAESSTTTPSADTNREDIPEVDPVEYYSQDFSITNSTGVSIVELYLSQSDVDNWEEDLLNGSAFAAGETVNVTTDIPGTADTMWDLLAVDEDGDELEFYDINLSSIVALELHWGDGLTPSYTQTNAGEEEFYNQDVTLKNSTGVDIMELYISTAEDNDWGADLLGEDLFAANDTFFFTTELVGTADATWDILIVDEDGDEIVFQDVNFSVTSALDLNWGTDGVTPMVVPIG